MAIRKKEVSSSVNNDGPILKTIATPSPWKRFLYPQTFNCSKQQWKLQEKVWNMFQILTKKTLERSQQDRSSVFIVNFEHMWYLFFFSIILILQDKNYREKC